MYYKKTETIFKRIKQKIKQRESEAAMRKGKSAGTAKRSSMNWGVLAIMCIAAFILVFETTAMTVAILEWI